MARRRVVFNALRSSIKPQIFNRTRTMFTDPISAIFHAHRERILLAAAGLMMLILLFSVGSVASAQVNKAKVREAAHASQYQELAQCLENSRGAQIDACKRQVGQARTQTPLADAG